MEKEKIEPRFAVAGFERRKHPRFSVALPVEYYKINSRNSLNGRVLNASESGVMVNLPEMLEVDRYLITKLFFIFDLHINNIEIFAQVTWRNIHLGRDSGFRAGLRFVGISPEDMNKWRGFLNHFYEFETPAERSLLIST